MFHAFQAWAIGFVAFLIINKFIKLSAKGFIALMFMTLIPYGIGTIILKLLGV